MKLTMRRISVLAVVVASAIGLAACGSSSTTTGGSGGSSGSTSGPATVNGAGSTFAAPIYEQWAQTLGKGGLTVPYGPVGSGTGVADLQTATVTFAGNDSPLKSADRSGAKGPLLQFPVAFGAITV